ncbi:MAG TPA: hypothetical protein VKV15_17110 [Bryobacteraceae bacterium]|nr:hypothetical protein [Bryobacteraceae bacterium]
MQECASIAGRTPARRPRSQLSGGGRTIHALDYSLQANQKTLEGSQHADRDEQFEYINRKVKRYLKQGQPVISVDTKKKESDTPAERVA